MAFGKWLLLFLIPLLISCRAVSTIAGVREPNLDKFKQAGNRFQVEKVLGQPIWSPGSADGLNYEVYQFRPAEPARPTRGAVIFAVDALTLGLMEFNISRMDPSRAVKQVAVAYDARDEVRSVSKDWLVSDGWMMDTPGPGPRSRSSLPAEAGVPATAHPAPLARPDDPEGQSAILEWGMFFHVTVDGEPLPGRKARLKPGSHLVEYRHQTEHDVLARVDLWPGRAYYLMAEFPNNTAGIPGHSWIEDEDSHEILWCIPW
jgi:hypothetical protein